MVEKIQDKKKKHIDEAWEIEKQMKGLYLKKPEKKVYEPI